LINVVITGVGGGVGHAIIKSLRTANLELRLIGLDMNPWAGGIYRCDQGYLVPAVNHPDYPAVIKEICAKENAQILFPGTDFELPILATMKAELAAIGCTVVCGDTASIHMTRNKLKTFKFFQSKMLPFVLTVELNNIEELIKRKGFPIIIKPVSGSTSQGVKVFLNAQSLNDFLRQTIDKQNEYIAQEYLVPVTWQKNKQQINSTDIFRKGMLSQRDEVSIQVLVGKDSTILGCFTSINTLRHGTPYHILPAKGHPAEAIAIQMAQAMQELGLSGPCNFQCRVTTDGPVFFEVNPRFTNMTGVRAGMGFNECEALLRHFILNEEAAKIRECLDYDNSLMCSRYDGDFIFSKAAFTELQTSGKVIGKGVVTQI